VSVFSPVQIRQPVASRAGEPAAHRLRDPSLAEEMAHDEGLGVSIDRVLALVEQMLRWR
jgi:hypothetical protein